MWIRTLKNPSTVLGIINKQKVNMLADSGADCSVISYAVYRQSKIKNQIRHTNVDLRTVTGRGIKVLGQVDIQFTLGNKDFNNTFLVAGDMEQHMILGTDFLHKFGVKLCFRTRTLQIGNWKHEMTEERQIKSLVRARHNVMLGPRTINMIIGRIKNSSHFRPEQTVMSQKLHNDIKGEPGILVTECICNIDRDRQVQMLITNDTDKAVKVNKGCVIGQIREWRETKTETRKECFVNYIRQDITERENTLKEQISTSQENRIRVEKCVLENQDIFALSDLELGRTDTVTMEIDTVPDQPPINIRPYKTPLRNREIIETAIEEMLRAGIVTRSRSEWASPVVLVTKKDGTHRFCCDYRALNKITKDIAYPMPNIEEVLGTLSNSVHFTTLDARSGFWSIGMSAEATEKSTFTCHMGTFGWNVMPYGLKGSPGT